MINIKSYSTDKISKSTIDVSSNSGFVKAATTTAQGVNIWGHWHDHSADVNGDLYEVGNINMEGDINLSNGNINGVNDIEMIGDINGAYMINTSYANIEKKLNVQDIRAHYLEVDEIDATEVFAEYGEIGDISSETISADISITTDQVNSNNITNDNTITTKNLNVTGSAHFFELVIDKIKAAGGSVLLTPADGFKVDKVDDGGVYQVDDFSYNDNDQMFIKDCPFYLTLDNVEDNDVGVPSGTNILAEFTTSCHNLKFFYSWGVNQRSALLYSDGSLKSGTYGNQNDSFVSPYIYVGDVRTIEFISDGLPQDSGNNAKLAAYDENLNYIQSNSVANKQTFVWDRGETTKWIRFTGRNAYPNGKIIYDGKTTGDVTIKYLWQQYPKNGNQAISVALPKIFLNKCSGFKLYRDNHETVFHQKDELIYDGIPVYDTINNVCTLYDTISETYAISHGTNSYKPGNRTDDGYEELDGIKLMFRTNDGERAIKNMWKVNDQALCQSFNEAEVGTTSQVSNKYYWSLVDHVGTCIVDGVEYHYIIISDDVYDGTLNCEVGDEIAMCGYRGTDDANRQSAIYIAAYNTLDAGLTPPLLAQYQGINDFNLSNHRKNVISNGYNEFKGQFTTTSGDDIEDLINDVSAGAITYMHTAYSNSSNGQLNFSKTYFSNAKYMGFCSNHTESDTTLTYQDYTWVRIKGEDGVTPDMYKMTADTQYIRVRGNGYSDTPNFYIRGWQFVNGQYVELTNYEAIMTESYAHYNDFVDNVTLPYEIQPDRMDQEYDEGLYNIKFEIYDGNDEYIAADINIGILRDGENGDDGANAEQVILVPSVERIDVNADQTVSIKLEYNIIKVVGSTYTTITPSQQGYHVVGTAVEIDRNQTLAFSISGNVTSYTNNNYQSNWLDNSHRLDRIIVNLYNGDSIIPYAKRTVYAEMKNTATLTITDAITSTVTGHTNTISGMQNDISILSQTASSISTRVTLIENTYVTSSQLSQTATSIQAYITNGLLQTGINISDNSIELRGDNVTFTSSDGTQSGKIYIDPTTGALHASEANLDGTLISENTTMMNKIEVNGPSGYFKMQGPDHIEDGTVLPATGAQQVDLFSIEFRTDPDDLCRYTNLAMYSDNNIIQLNPLDGLQIYDNDYGLFVGKTNIQYNDGNDIYLRYYEDLLTNTVDVKAISTTTHTATKEDSLLIFTGSNTARTLTLPDPVEMQGKVMYVKNINGSSLRVTCSVNNSIIAQNSSSTSNYVDIQKNSAIFISTGGYWVRFA